MRDPSTADLHHGEIANLEDLIDRDSLREVCRSFFDLFGLSIRVFSARGGLLANVHEERSICRYVNAFTEGGALCNKTVGEVQVVVPSKETVVHPCFTGAVYHVVPIIYDDRQLGRIVLGPFLPAELREVPPTLLAIDAGVDRERVRLALREMPRVRPETAERIASHLRGVLDLILFSGHRAHLTSAMHLATVRENYRDLAEKNTSLQEAYDRLRELDRLKSNFLATVSHELRTPLTSIIGYSEMLQAGIAGEMNDEQSSFVETIRSKGELLLSLISSLLDLNKLEVDCGDDVPQLQADPVRLRQILLNLAGNALKFTPENGRVRLCAVPAEMTLNGEGGDDDDVGAALMMALEPAVEFRVTDSGIGIASDQVEKIFDAFYQVDGGSTREYGGAGLGLAIAKNLVEAHHGTIRVESKPEEGSTFFVTLPQMQPDPS